MQRLFGSIYWHPTLLKAFAAMLCFAGALWAVLEYLSPAPPSTITIATGVKGGAYEYFGQQYRQKLARDHVTLNRRLTDGTLANIKLLEDPRSGVQVGFVQGGASDERQAPGLLSLGRVNYQAFWIFYRGTETLDHLTQLKGKRIAIGSEAVVANEVLGAAGVNSKTATLFPLGGAASLKALNDGAVDAMFIALAPDAEIIQTLLRDPDVRLMSVAQTEALTRIFPFLVRLVLPQGVIDLEHDIPPADTYLIGTTNAVVVRDDLNPEIINLLAKTLSEVHGGAGIFQKAGEFPTATDPEFAMADGAREFYKSGPTYLDEYLSARMASLIKKVIAVVLSCTVILVPFSHLLPKLTRWIVRDRMFHLYRRLRIVETKMQTDLTAAQLEALQSDLESIERSANDLGVPMRYSDLLFELKNHINGVRQRLGLRRAALQSEMRKVG